MVRVRVSTSRVCKASKDTLWNILEDVDNWHKWASDTSSKTYMISHKTVHRESNTVVICDEEEVVGGYTIKHRDRYTFYPKEKRITEEIIKGPISGTFDLRLIETSNRETKLIWDFDVKAESLKFKIIGLFKGKNIVQGVADEYCRQLAEYAEARQQEIK
jgi:hypothetical protein